MPTKSPTWDKLNLVSLVKKAAMRLRRYKHTPEKSRAFQRHMAAMGFVEHHHAGSASETQWRHIEGGIIVKQSYFCRGRRPAAAVPTIRLHGRHQRRLVVQPLCDISNQYGALLELEAAGLDDFCDRHTGNVAHFNGKAVAIDW